MYFLALLVCFCCFLFRTIYCLKSEKKQQSFSLMMSAFCLLNALLICSSRLFYFLFSVCRL